MNVFTNHDFGLFADDGFGNLIRLSFKQSLIALNICLSEMEEYEYYDE